MSTETKAQKVGWLVLIVCLCSAIILVLTVFGFIANDVWKETAPCVGWDRRGEVYRKVGDKMVAETRWVCVEKKR